jgi:hypothetical protein
MTKILDRTTLGFIRPLIPLLKPAYYSIGMIQIDDMRRLAPILAVQITKYVLQQSENILYKKRGPICSLVQLCIIT